MNIFETSFYELIFQLVKNDYGDTFSAELEKDFFKIDSIINKYKYYNRQ